MLTVSYTCTMAVLTLTHTCTNVMLTLSYTCKTVVLTLLHTCTTVVLTVIHLYHGRVDDTCFCHSSVDIDKDILQSRLAVFTRSHACTTPATQDLGKFEVIHHVATLRTILSYHLKNLQHSLVIPPPESSTQSCHTTSRIFNTVLSYHLQNLHCALAVGSNHHPRPLQHTQGNTRNTQ